LRIFAHLALLGMKAAIPKISDLSPLELKRKIPVPEAAALNSMHPATFKRHYKHLIRKISPRREAVELGDAINLPPAPSD
jgi:hypothetical protein